MLRILCLFVLVASFGPIAYGDGVPVIYSTDLYHPHDDPDDHFDLATLFAMPELDVKGIIIDMANIHQQFPSQSAEKKPGIVALRQMFRLSGREVPFTTGLDQPLRSPDDQGLTQDKNAQGAVELILTTLRQSQEKVSIFTVGSLRDVAAAYNREPDLLRAKVRAIYANVGTGPEGFQEEWNVGLDREAYRRILLSELPVQWYPCFGRDNYYTWFIVDQSKVLDNVAPQLKAYFDYALTQSQEDPLTYLSRSLPAPTGPRNMWCTPSFIDLAGRKIYRTERGYEALAQPPQPGAASIDCYRMVPVRLTEQPEPVPETSAPGSVAAQYLSCSQDLLGKTSWQPDGVPDCLVRITGWPAGKAVRSATLTGPHEGVWLSDENPTRWLLKTTWQQNVLQLAFTFYAAGVHQLDVTFDDDSKATVSFSVPIPGSPLFSAQLDAAQSNVHVPCKQEPLYTEVMTSCLKNLLESYPLAN